MIGERIISYVKSRHDSDETEVYNEEGDDSEDKKIKESGKKASRIGETKAEGLNDSKDWEINDDPEEKSDEANRMPIFNPTDENNDDPEEKSDEANHMPIFNPSDLVDRTFLMEPQENGERFRA
jgi:hypothetical protein